MNATATPRHGARLTSSPEAPSSESRIATSRPSLVDSTTLFRFYVQIQGTAQNVRDLHMDPERRDKAEVYAERLEDIARELRNFSRERG